MSNYDKIIINPSISAVDSLLQFYRKEFPDDFNSNPAYTKFSRAITEKAHEQAGSMNKNSVSQSSSVDSDTDAASSDKEPDNEIMIMEQARKMKKKSKERRSRVGVVTNKVVYQLIIENVTVKSSERVDDYDDTSQTSSYSEKKTNMFVKLERKQSKKK